MEAFGSSMMRRMGFLSKVLASGHRVQAVGTGQSLDWSLDHSDLRQCRWFAECLDHQGASWVFAAGESYRSIASLELLATLAAVLLFEPGGGDGVAGCFSAGTDNKGNSHAVSRCMTTKFPLCVFNMELAVQLQREEQNYIFTGCLDFRMWKQTNSRMVTSAVSQIPSGFASS